MPRPNIAIVLLSVFLIASGSLVRGQAAASGAEELNMPPVAKHGDRIVVDEDGDGEEAVTLVDRYSQDPDETRGARDESFPCSHGATDYTRDGIDFWEWFDTTGIAADEFTLNSSTHLGSGDVSKHHVFGVGEHEIALRVEDFCRAHGWTNFTLAVVDRAVPLYQMSGGVDEHWQLTGPWTSTGSCEAANDADDSRPPYLAFTRITDDGCSYLTGERPSGNATLTVDLLEQRPAPDHRWTKVGLQFVQWWDTRRSGLDDRDRMTIQASFDGGETWIGAASTNTGCGNASTDAGRNCWDGDSVEPHAWNRGGIGEGYDLVFPVPVSEDADEVWFRWSFDTVVPRLLPAPVDGPGADRQGTGWFIDDVDVLGLESTGS